MMYKHETMIIIINSDNNPIVYLYGKHYYVNLLCASRCTNPSRIHHVHYHFNVQFQNNSRQNIDNVKSNFKILQYYNYNRYGYRIDYCRRIEFKGKAGYACELT